MMISVVDMLNKSFEITGLLASAPPVNGPRHLSYGGFINCTDLLIAAKYDPARQEVNLISSCWDTGEPKVDKWRFHNRTNATLTFKVTGPDNCRYVQFDPPTQHIHYPPTQPIHVAFVGGIRDGEEMMLETMQQFIEVSEQISYPKFFVESPEEMTKSVEFIIHRYQFAYQIHDLYIYKPA